MDLKRLAAHRMLNYPQTFENDSLLKFALKHLDSHSFLDDILYQLTLPLGQLFTEITRLQDHWEVVHIIRSSLKPRLIRQSAHIDWNSLVSTAEAEQKLHATNNPYGIDNKIWNNINKNSDFIPKVPGSGDQTFIDNTQKSKEWDDFEILLMTLNELGATPLIMTRPMNGSLFEALGVSSNARQFFYNTLEKTVAPYGMPVVDFRDHDTDIYFSVDPTSHPSRKGWVLVDQVLDLYFHDKIH
jgi:poly-D-alanine transfer protein DltD